MEPKFISENSGCLASLVRALFATAALCYLFNGLGSGNWIPADVHVSEAWSYVFFLLVIYFFIRIKIDKKQRRKEFTNLEERRRNLRQNVPDLKRERDEIISKLRRM